ncbi:MAG TPA: hypothetical protein VM638_09510 [Actinomycetota bacterium]|nr:hypothetical protein [Actinomycetota bacterium]
MIKRDLGPQGAAEAPYAITSSKDGSEIYVLASGATLDAYGAAVLVFDAANGAWRRTIPVPYRFLGPNSDFSPYLLAAGDGSVFVSGFLRVREETPEGFARHQNFLTASYSPTGDLRWWRVYRGPMSGRGTEHGEFPVGMTLSPDGRQLIVTGVSTRPGPYQADPRYIDRYVPPDDVATVAYDPATGTERWVERFDSGKLEFPYGFAVGPDGDDLYVNVMSWRFESTLVAFRGLRDTEDGPELSWTHSEDPASFLAPIAIAATRDTVVLAGVSLSNPSNTVDYGIVAVGLDGKVRWRASHSNVYTIAGTDYTSTDLPMAMVADDDRVYVTGYAYEWDALYALGDTSPAMVPSTVAFDLATGSLSWQKTYRFPGHRIHFPFGLHLAGSRLYVPGLDSECNWYVMNPNYYCKSTMINLVTLDHDAATGSLQRVARFNHARSVSVPGLQPSPPAAPGFALYYGSTLGPDRQLSIVTLFDAPCVECHPAARWRLGLVAYGPPQGS